MTTIRAYTTIEQSRKLAEILPLESADQTWERITSLDAAGELQYGHEYKHNGDMPFQLYSGIGVPCWSLAALFSVLPFHIIANNQGYAFSMHKGLNKDGETYMVRYNVFNTDVCLYKTEYYNNPIDACYEMIIKLHELKKL